MTTVAQVLHDAGELIHENGWIQGSSFRDGKRCAWGAITKANPYEREVGQNHERVALTEAAVDAVLATIDPAELPTDNPLYVLRTQSQRLAAWNDAYGRTQADVLHHLKLAERAARRTENEGASND